MREFLGTLGTVLYYGLFVAALLSLCVSVGFGIWAIFF
jgi:hypothetical protein